MAQHGVTLTINVQQTAYPTGTAGGEWHIDVFDPSDLTTPLHSYAGNKPQASFDLAAGMYMFRAYRLDAEGKTIGVVLQGLQHILDNPAMIDVPTSWTFEY